MIKNIYFICFLTSIFITGCLQKPKNESVKEIDTVSLDSEPVKLELKNEDFVQNESYSQNKDSMIKSLAERADTSQHHFSFKLEESSKGGIFLFTGYSDYSDDEFEFENPAYLKVFNDDKLIYEDTFKGYEEIRFQDFDGYLFNDSVRLFTVKFGLQACDYINPVRLYQLNDNKVGFIDEFYSQSTDYASKYIEYIFPVDSGGIENTIVVIERIDYRTGEEPNKAETIYYKFEGDKFTKTTNK